MEKSISIEKYNNDIQKLFEKNNIPFQHSELYNEITNKKIENAGNPSKVKAIAGSSHIPFIPNLIELKGNGSIPPPFYLYDSNNKQIISNEQSFRQLTNINEIITDMSKVIRDAYKDELPLNPFENFVLKIVENSKTKKLYGELKYNLYPTLDEKYLNNKKQSSIDFAESFIQKFLGYNYIIDFKNNKVLEELLNELKFEVGKDKKNIDIALNNESLKKD